jgi:glutamate racemase
MRDGPIGVFDSGFGGLSVARALIDLLPGERLVYLGDTGRYPYGPRPQRQVAGFARQITTKLVDEHQVKMVVVACNTATAAAIEDLQDHFDVPVIGVIEPGLRSAIRATTHGRVGVIGTVGTIGSGAYQHAAQPWTDRGTLSLTCAACPGFVEFVERGELTSDQVVVLAERLLAPIIDAKVDTLLLGCTHYPFLARTISDVVGRDVVLVSSAEETAFEVRSLLTGGGTGPDGGGSIGGIPFRPTQTETQSRSEPEEEGRHPVGRRNPGPGGHMWISSGDAETFLALGRRLLGPEIDHVEYWNPDYRDRP